MVDVQPLHFISIIALVFAIGGVAGHFMEDTRTEKIVDEKLEPYKTAVDGLVANPIDESTVRSWINAANTQIISRIDTLEKAPAPTGGVTEAKVNQLIDNKILLTPPLGYDIDGSIKALKAKDTAIEADIKDLEDDRGRSSSSSGDEDTTIDRISNFYDRDDSITFTGRTVPGDEVELFLKHQDDRDFDDTNLTDRADQNGLWVIICRDMCTEDLGEYEVYVENLDNGDESRVLDYEVQR